jgi:hypothetical protein
MPLPPQVSENRASERRFSGQEVGAAAALFTLLSFTVFGWYAFHGGFVADDWVNADHYYFPPEPGLWGAVENYQTPSRPIAAIWVTLTYALLGTDFAAHLVLSVLLAAFLSTAFFAFLRILGLDLTLALAAAALLLVFPSSDSTRLWSTGSQINLFIGLYLLAAIVAIAGRRRFGPAPTVPAVLTQVLASALAVTAVAGYEIVAPAVLLSVFLYRWAGGSGGAVWRWLLDAIPTVLVLLFYTHKFGDSAEGGQLLTNVRLLADGAISVLGYSFLPIRDASRWAVVGGVAAVVLATLLVRWVPAKALRGERRDEIGRWFGPMVLAIVAIVVGYLMIAPAADRYPLYAPGVQNRTNCFAALGISALVVFVAAALASIVAGVIPNLSLKVRARLRDGLIALAVLGTLGVYTVRVSEDSDRWVRSAEMQAQILDEAHALLPSPPAEATIFTSPYPGYSSPSVPIFGGGGNNDQLGAFKVSYDSEELRSFPLLEGNEAACGPTTVAVSDAGNSETDYGKAIFVDFRTDTIYRPSSRSECVRDTEAMKPYGPVNLSEQW